jgi:hypothetical protein
MGRALLRRGLLALLIAIASDGLPFASFLPGRIGGLLSAYDSLLGFLLYLGAKLVALKLALPLVFVRRLAGLGLTKREERLAFIGGIALTVIILLDPVLLDFLYTMVALFRGI